MEANKKPLEKIVFYADCPNVSNKRFQYAVHDLNHTQDLLNKFVAKGCKIRKAWHTFANGREMALDIILPTIDGNLSNTYTNTKKLDESLDKKQGILRKTPSI